MSTNRSAEEERSLRVTQIAAYLSEEVIGNNPNPSTMTRYAERLHDVVGFDSVQQIQARMQRRHVESFHWMASLHKEIALEKFGNNERRHS